MIPTIIELELTGNEVKVLDRLFDVLTETQLHSHGFTQSEINDVYSVIAEVRAKRDIHNLWSDSNNGEAA